MSERLNISVLGIQTGSLEIGPEHRGIRLDDAVRNLRGAESLRMALGTRPEWILDCGGIARRLDPASTLGQVVDTIASLGLALEQSTIDLAVEARGGGR